MSGHIVTIFDIVINVKGTPNSFVSNGSHIQAHIVLLHCVCACVLLFLSLFFYQKAMTQSLIVQLSVESCVVTLLVLMQRGCMLAQSLSQQWKKMEVDLLQPFCFDYTLSVVSLTVLFRSGIHFSWSRCCIDRHLLSIIPSDWV